MPKMKTHSGAKKRFSRTASGKIKFRRGKRNHILEHRSKKMKRQARGSGYLSPGDQRLVQKLLPN